MRPKLILRCCLVLIAVATSAGARAKPPETKGSPPIYERACSAKALQSPGYRDMLTRFISRQGTHDSSRSLRFDSSYRDHVARHHTPTHSGLTGSVRPRPRYSLRATPSCG